MAVRHTFIHKDGKTKTANLTRGKAIREKCLECSAWQEKEVRECPAKDCALYPYRMGSVKRAKEVGVKSKLRRK